MINQEVKGTLARLLATENLTVEHRRVTTACFDVDKRLLVLPIWKDASSTVYDLLVGHEVGHALYTPVAAPEGYNKAFVNVLEDVRIERLMKKTYPGLKKTFFTGYRELWDRDFFGVAGEDLDTIPFIDRINLYFKGNAGINFTDEERVYVDRAANTNSFEEVLDLARDLYGLAQEYDQKRSEELQGTQGELNFQDDQEELELEESGDEGSEAPVGDAPTNFQEGDTSSEPEVGNEPIGGETWDGTHKQSESLTESAFSQALETLVDDNAKEWVYLTLPKVKLDEFIVPAKDILEELNCHFLGHALHDEQQQEYYYKCLNYSFDHYNKFKKSAQKSVNYLLKQFEMKKSADQYKRAAVSKTGVINTNALHKYKITDDIFKKITTVPDGKNHGLVMFLDWSGSMSTTILDTLKQVYNLVWFCKKANIPFRVYGFQNGGRRDSYYSVGRREYFHKSMKVERNSLAIDSDVDLLEFLSSQQPNRQLEDSMKMLYVQAFCFHNHRIDPCQRVSLGGTPLAEAIYVARDIVNAVKKVERVSKVNVVCLTDGEANPMSYVDKNEYYDSSDHPYRTSSLSHRHDKVFFLRDKVTGYTRKLEVSPYRTTQQIVSFFREITDYNWIGIRLCSKGDANRIFRTFAYEKVEDLDRTWKKDRFASIKDTFGFTEAFFIPDQNLGQGTLDLEVKQKGEVATRAELGRAFKKHMGSKMTNKTVLNRFIEQIA